MACSIAENTPLKRLAEELKIPHLCHSTRPRCIMGLEQRHDNNVFGIPGAAIGYCQALFNYEGTPSGHTNKVTKLLSEIEAPWTNSHELFWGYKGQNDTNWFLNEAIRPLLGTGRIPVLISALDPAASLWEIEEIISSRPPTHSGETILLRIVLSGENSIKNFVHVVKNILAECREKNELPVWWPLVQGILTIEQWKNLKNLLGRDWKYLNIAVNPFVEDDVFEIVKDQITVAQIPVGLPTGISREGKITLAKGVKIMGAPDEAQYDLSEFVEKLNQLDVAPTLIILGPSLPEWSDAINQLRIAKLLPFLRENCNVLWDGLTDARREFVWKMAA